MISESTKETLSLIHNAGKFRATYKDPDGINQEMDTAINGAAVAIGLKWTGQGMDLHTGIRDICFEEQEQDPMKNGPAVIERESKMF